MKKIARMWGMIYFSILAFMILLAMHGCTHSVRPNPGHLAAGCLSVCHNATYVEVSPKGDLCRCWAPNAVTYIFEFPDDPEKITRDKYRWDSAIKKVNECRISGFAWQAAPDGVEVMCLKPGTYHPPSLEPLLLEMLNHT